MLPTRSDINQAVRPKIAARGLEFLIEKVEELYYLCIKNKGSDQLCCYRVADLRLCFRTCKKAGHDVAHISLSVNTDY